MPPGARERFSLTSGPDLPEAVMAGSDLSDEASALEACEQEPIRTPGRTQPHGFLCTFDAELERMLHVSGNAGDYLNETTDN